MKLLSSCKIETIVGSLAPATLRINFDIPSVSFATTKYENFDALFACLQRDILLEYQEAPKGISNSLMQEKKFLG